MTARSIMGALRDPQHTDGSRGRQHTDSSGARSSDAKTSTGQALLLGALLAVLLGASLPSPQPPSEQAAAAQPLRLSYPVWWHAPFWSGTGYGAEAISVVAALLLTNTTHADDVWISHSGDVVSERADAALDPATRQLLQGLEYNSLARRGVDVERPALAICHCFPECWLLKADDQGMQAPGCPCPARSAAQDRVLFRIGRTMFETDGLPQHLVRHVQAMDEVWVPTEFNRATFIAAGVDARKLRVVPRGIDGEVFDPRKHQSLLLRALPGAQLLTGTPPGQDAGQQRPHVFMSLFKFEARKSWDVLLQAYLEAFRNSSQPVELHIMAQAFAGGSSKHMAPHMTSWLQRQLGVGADALAQLPRVYLHTRLLDDATYRRLYVSADCVVMPTRGEGWGRPQMEAMAMARPLITTNWSGPTAYINEQVAYPLAVDGLVPADGGNVGDGGSGGGGSSPVASSSSSSNSSNPFFMGQRWAQPSVAHLQQLMRQVVAHPAAARAKGAAARRHILAHFTPRVLARLVMQELLRVQDTLGPGHTLMSAADAAEQAARAALCAAHPQLCTLGPEGVAEATRRAQASLSSFRAHGGGGADARARPGRLTVAEQLALARQQGVAVAAAAGVVLDVG